MLGRFLAVAATCITVALAGTSSNTKYNIKWCGGPNLSGNCDIVWFDPEACFDAPGVAQGPETVSFQVSLKRPLCWAAVAVLKSM